MSPIRCQGMGILRATRRLGAVVHFETYSAGKGNRTTEVSPGQCYLSLPPAAIQEWANRLGPGG